MVSMKTCPNCQQEFKARTVEILGAKIFEAKYCDVCAESLCEQRDREAREREEQAVITRNRERWESLCPPLYRDTDPARLPQDVLNMAMAWEYGARGLILGGATGAGKTRIMFQLLRRLFDDGCTIRVYTASTFRAAVTNAQMENSFEEWLDRASKTDVFYFDDLGQMKLTESSEEALLAVIEGRAAQQKPIFATMQYTGEEFVAQFIREHRGRAILRRLKDFCEMISL